MHCPSCGAEIDADRQYAHMVVCEYCRSSVILDTEAARLSGKMAVLPAALSPLYVGGSGRIHNHRFRVLGRVRYGYEMGFWDEWYLSLDDGSTVWVSEDERALTLERLKTDQTPNISYDETQPGDNLRLGKKTLQVAEKGVANCEGAEGQLPFPIQLGEKVPFLDLTDGKNSCTIEYDEDGKARIYWGRHLRGRAVKMDMTAEEAGVTASGTLQTERAATETSRERVVKRSGRSESIKCSSCAATLPIPEDGADSVTCEHCGTVLNLLLRRVECESCGVDVPVHGGDDAESVVCPHCRSHLRIDADDRTSVLASLKLHERPRIPFPLGTKCRFDGHEFILVGHVRYREFQDLVYITDEFLLYNKQDGYRWLSRYQGHYSISEPLDEIPKTVSPKVAARKSRFPFDGRTYQVFETNHGGYEISWVDGELPWVATVCDKSSYMDAISPPYLLSAEWTAKEMEWDRSRYLTREEVAAAFDVEPEKVSAGYGVAPNQPYPAGPFRRESAWVMFGFAMLNLFLMVCFWGAGREVQRYGISPTDYAQEFVTEPFEITHSNALCEVEYSADVDNSWVYLDVAVVDSQDRAVIETSAEMSYYHGYEGGESWSEGSRSDSSVFKLAKPGEYRFLLQGQAGAGETASSVSAYGKAVSIKVFEGIVLARYFGLAAIVGLTWAGIEWFRRYWFEARRWGDDDDDDDD